MMKRFFRSVFVFIILIAPFGQYAISIPIASAQSSFEPWTTPVNLSQSGSTGEPSAVLDSNGILSVIWYDKEDELFFYTRLEGNEWSEPVNLNVPFESENPRLLLHDPRGVIHAFWTNEDNGLLYAYISIDSLIKRPAWSRVQFLSSGVIDFDAKVDSKGKIHLVYARVDDINNFPAGIYHRSADKPGGPWADSSLLYESRYFRSLNVETASVKIAVTQVNENDYIFIAWDNRPLKQIYLIKSIDGGNQWQEVELIDGPTESLPLVDPFHLLVHAYGSNVLLIWEAGLQSGIDCTQYSQFSSDLGLTWLERQVMFNNIVGCSQDNRIFDLDNGSVLMSIIQDQVYLTAWNGQEWGEPQPQGVLSGFTDQDTFNTVLFRCYQTVISGRQLYVVGCDIEGDGDIWATTRDLGPLSDWFGQSIDWTKPVLLTDAQLNITSPLIICAPEEQEHVFWSQTLEEGKSIFDTAIFYARLDENRWTQPTRVLDTPETRAVQPVVMFDNQEHLIAVWGSSDNTGIYSSIASIGQAVNAFNWSDSVLLPSLQSISSSPDVLIDQMGNILVVYAIGVNEDRGVYLIQSNDGGKTWGQPIRVFDAVGPKWTRVDQPKLAQTSDGMLHLVWTQNSLTDYLGATALYYSRSEDGGSSWSQPRLVVQEPLGWEQILIPEDDTIHIFWSTKGKPSGLRHEFSRDFGSSWSAPHNLTGNEENPGPIDVVSDKEGRLHLVQAVQNTTGLFLIKYLVWNGARWSIEDISNLSGEISGNITGLGACIDSKGQLSVVYSLIPADILNRMAKESLYVTGRFIKEPALEDSTLTQFFMSTQVITPTLETLTAEVIRTPTAESTQPTSEQISPTEIVPPGGNVETPTTSTFVVQPWVGLTLGLGLALVIVILVFGLILRSRKRRGYY